MQGDFNQKAAEEKQEAAQKAAETVEDIAQLRYLENEELQFALTEGGFLSLKIGEQSYPRVALQRAFPLSMPYEYISVRSVGENREPDQEIGVIRDIRALPKEKVELIEKELNTRYFTPIIRQITSLKDEYGYIYMNIRTDAGSKSATVPNSGNHFIKLTETRILVIDADGNRYEIPDITELDKKSMHLLEVVL